VSDVQVRSLDWPTETEIVALADIFDAYRAHYGEAIEPGASAAWLAEQLGSGRLTAFVAERDGQLLGFATTLDVPASLRLGHYWQVRDLFVVTDRRRLGIGAALLVFVADAARSAGALRLAVQTEFENDAARRLYQATGFVEVEGFVGLIQPLQEMEAG
jgi:GNAT superfamily N-acetyltransferase